MSDIDWKGKAHAMKDMYEQLVNLRIDSVKQDIAELHEKISEHKRIHEIAVNELRRQNENLEVQIEEVKAFKDGLTAIQSSVIKSRRELGLKDPILRKVFKYDQLHLLNKSKNKYLIGKGKNYAYQFVISKTEKDDYIYEGVEVPNSISVPDEFDNDIHEWVGKRIRFNEKSFDVLLATCANMQFDE